jgi:hypothetical protein
MRLSRGCHPRIAGRCTRPGWPRRPASPPDRPSRRDALPSRSRASPGGPTCDAPCSPDRIIVDRQRHRADNAPCGDHPADPAAAPPSHSTLVGARAPAAPLRNRRMVGAAMIGHAADTAVITAQLTEAARRRQPLEVIVVFRGRVRPAGSRTPGRWYVRVEGQRVFTFPAAGVVAATPIAPQARTRRGA